MRQGDYRYRDFDNVGYKSSAKSQSHALPDTYLITSAFPVGLSTAILTYNVLKLKSDVLIMSLHIHCKAARTHTHTHTHTDTDI